MAAVAMRRRTERLFQGNHAPGFLIYITSLVQVVFTGNRIWQIEEIPCILGGGEVKCTKIHETASDLTMIRPVIAACTIKVKNF
jgi:hypothetical protein